MGYRVSAAVAGLGASRACSLVLPAHTRSRLLLLFLCSEVLAHESVACLNRALGHLRDIWEEIGIPEDQRLQRTEVVRKHVQVRRGCS